METLVPGQPLTTKEPTVATDAKLPVGTYSVSLIVQSARGKSLPATLLIKVIKE